MDGTTTLDSVLQQAHVVQVSSVSGFGVNGEIMVDLSDPAKSERLRTAVAVESLPGFHYMCVGDVRFELFDPSGGRLAVVLHHGATLRWGSGRATPSSPTAACSWRGWPGTACPAPRFESDLLRAEEGAEDERNWLAAMPAGLDQPSARCD